MKQIYSMVQALINERQKLQEERFYFDLSVECDLGQFWIVRKRDWLGVVYDDGSFLLPPVFDHISFFPNTNYAKLSVDDYWGVYNVITKQWGVFPVCRSLILNEDYNTIELVTSEGHGLYCMKENRIVINPVFDEVTCYSGGDYLWVRLGEWYHFVNKDKGKLITIEARKAYDTPHGIFALGKDNKVFCANEEGLDDPISLRRFVIKNHGRGSLYNYKYHNVDIIDIYGYIL